MPGYLDFGFALLPDYWRTDYATEVLIAIIHFAFTILDESGVFGECDLKDAAIADVMEKTDLRRIILKQIGDHSVSLSRFSGKCGGHNTDLKKSNCNHIV